MAWQLWKSRAAQPRKNTYHGDTEARRKPKPLKRSATEPQPKSKTKTFETQRNRGSRGQNEEPGNWHFKEQKPNLTMRRGREEQEKANLNEWQFRVCN